MTDVIKSGDAVENVLLPATLSNMTGLAVGQKRFDISLEGHTSLHVVCGCNTAPAALFRMSISCSIIPSFVNKTLRYLNPSLGTGALHLEKTYHLFLVENHCLQLEDADFYSSWLTLDPEAPQYRLQVLVQGSQKNTVM